MQYNALQSLQADGAVCLQVTDFDVAVTAQEEPVPCSTTVFSFAHMAPEIITDKQLTKVTQALV